MIQLTFTENGIHIHGLQFDGVSMNGEWLKEENIHNTTQNLFLATKYRTSLITVKAFFFFKNMTFIFDLAKTEKVLAQCTM